MQPISWFISLAHLGLGRADVLQDDTSKARIAYQNFFAFWKAAAVIPQYVNSALSPSVYAYTRLNTRRNLYRIQLP